LGGGDVVGQQVEDELLGAAAALEQVGQQQFGVELEDAGEEVVAT
jgi:hypothetical protein